MSAERETIMAAFTQAVFAVSDFQTTGRRVLLWSNVSEMPACFVRNTKDVVKRVGFFRELTMEIEVWIYTNAGQDPSAAAGAALNDLVDAVEGALMPDDTQLGTFTLGGLVQHCWIEGEVEYDPGDIDGFGKAVIPVRILVP